MSATPKPRTRRSALRAAKRPGGVDSEDKNASLLRTHSKKPLWIAIGVKGVWFYTGSGQKDWQAKPAGLVNKPEEGHWDYAQKLVCELRELEPAIMAKPVTIKIALSPDDAPVEFTGSKPCASAAPCCREEGLKCSTRNTKPSSRAKRWRMSSGRFG